MSDKIYTIDEIRSLSAPVAQACGLERVYLFGSYARGEAEPHSDIDFHIIKGRLHGVWQLAELMTRLENVFGKRIDLVTGGDPEFMSDIAKDEVMIYAAD